MIYALSIDWLALFCTSESGCINQYLHYWGYKLHAHGTRQYQQLITVSLHGEDFLEIQQVPCSSILQPHSMIIKVCNRFLYSRGMWYCLNSFLDAHKITVQNISRVDICADFNKFHNGLHPITLIKHFLGSELRHIGRGIGNAHFNHFAKKEGKFSKSYLNYTGLNFGSNESAARAYLYNKSFELLTVKDKPYIRQLWRESGLTDTPDVNVWRLEISIKSKGMAFKDKGSGLEYRINKDVLSNTCEIATIFHTFARSLFSFIKNREGITNVTREPRIQLFNGEPYLNRCVLESTSGGNRTERILIKQLWQLSDTYRGNEIVEDEGIAKLVAVKLASATGLSNWLTKKRDLWDKPTRK